MIVYGHEHGLRIVWYAGRDFKPRKDVSVPRVNGTSKGDAMVIDLDDDDDEPTPAETAAPPAEFEGDEAEVDPHAPYRDVVRSIDIPLGTTASRIAIPHVARDIAQALPGVWPGIYSNRIIVAAACSDLSLRVISAPLDPPAPDVQEISKMDVRVVRIEGTNSHQQFVSDLAITHKGTPSEEHAVPEGQEQSRPQIRSQPQPKSDNVETDSVEWSLLIASISCTGAGLLLIHQIPIRNNQISSSTESSLPIRRTYLRTSSMGAKLSFNTSPYPAERHSTLLVTFTSDSTVKVYQVFQQSHPRDRRGSNATNDSVSTTRSTRSSSADRGRFLITLLPPFRQEDVEVAQRRKRVLDAKWIAGGRAVIALLEDGEWGIWDLEAVGPTSSTSGTNLIRGQQNISGIHGGSLTRFAVRSNISPLAGTKQKFSNSQTQPTSGSLAPMTPSTRKVRSEGLFHGSKLNNDTTTPSTQQTGTIYVQDKSSDRAYHDESVVISYANENIYLPSILSFWKGEARPVRLPNVRLGGQIPRSIGLLPNPASSDNPFSDNTSPIPDFFVQTTHRLILSLNPLSSRAGSADVSTQAVSSPSDQTLLVSGDLDVAGMDRMLDDMGGAAASKKINLFTKSVGFRLNEGDDDGDVDMTASPTPSKAGQRITNANTGLGFGGQTPVPKRRIFS